jgi:hypothetical protein
MKGEQKERWLQLCEQAAVEQDAEKLLALIQEINRILEEKELRLKRGVARPAETRAMEGLGGVEPPT